jgi:hypothetical protein
MPQNHSNSRNEMSFGELLSWAWTETPPVHRNRINLLLHIVAVPMFVFAHILLLAAIFIKWWLAIAGVAFIAVSLWLQKIGHSLEQQPVIPFESLGDFVRRLYAEQFLNFWRFLLTGRWYAALRSRDGTTHPRGAPDA